MIDIEGALRDELDAVVGFVPTASKLYRPSPGRRAAIGAGRPASAPVSGDVVTVTAPAGYGKSTFVAELIVRGPTTGGVAVADRRRQRPRHTAHVHRARRSTPSSRSIRAACRRSGREPRRSARPALQRFGAMLADRRRPFVLVLDDVHELVSRDVLDILPALVARDATRVDHRAGQPHGDPAAARTAPRAGGASSKWARPTWRSTRSTRRSSSTHLGARRGTGGQRRGSSSGPRAGPSPLPRRARPRTGRTPLSGS